MRKNKLLFTTLLLVTLVSFVLSFVACGNGNEDMSKAPKYTVSFMNGNEIVNTQSITKGEKFSVPEIKPEKEGATFIGWALGNADAVYDFNAENAMIVNGHMIFNAKFERNFYTIKFVNEDGTELYSCTVRHGELPTYDGETPEKTTTDGKSYEFDGWTTAIVAATQNATYTAKYKEIGKQIIVPNGITIKTTDGVVIPSGTIFSINTEVILEFDYGYDKQAVIKDNDTVIATAVGPVTLKYPVTASVNLTVGTTDISSYSYGTNGATSGTGTLNIKDDGFINVPTGLQWGTVYTADASLGQSAKRSVSFEMKTSDLAKIVDKTNKITNIGIIFGSNALKMGISGVSKNGTNYKLTAYANGGTVSQAKDWIVDSSVDGVKLTFVSTITESRKDVVAVYLNGQEVGTITPTNEVDGRFGMWFDTRGASETVEYRHSYCVSNYVIV